MTTLLPNEILDIEEYVNSLIAASGDAGLKIVAVANVDTSSTVLVNNKSVGVTMVRNSTGNITGTLDDAMLDSNYIIQVSGANVNIVTANTDFAVVIDSVTQFTIELSNSGSPREGLFLITVIGEKA